MLPAILAAALPAVVNVLIGKPAEGVPRQTSAKAIAGAVATAVGTGLTIGTVDHTLGLPAFPTESLAYFFGWSDETARHAGIIISFVMTVTGSYFMVWRTSNRPKADPGHAETR